MTYYSLYNGGQSVGPGSKFPGWMDSQGAFTPGGLVLEQGGVSHTFGSVLLKMCEHNHCRTNQPNQDLLEGVVWARFHSNAGAVPLQREHSRPWSQSKEPGYLLPGNRQQKLAGQCEQYGLVPLCVVVFTLLYWFTLDQRHCFCDHRPKRP